MRSEAPPRQIITNVRGKAVGRRTSRRARIWGLERKGSVSRAMRIKTVNQIVKIILKIKKIIRKSDLIRVITVLKVPI